MSEQRAVAEEIFFHVKQKNKVDVPQFLISTAAITGIGLLWFEFNKKVFHTARVLLGRIIYEYYTDEETD